MLTENGDTITGTKNVLDEEVKFYSKLYTCECDPDKDIDEGISKLGITVNDIPKVKNEDCQTCEGILTLSECSVVVNEMKNTKSPGSDGYPVEFLKHFWDQVGPIIVDCFNYCFEKGCLTDEQRRGIISLIPKEGKNNLFLKNWRPITLLNVDYKVASKAIANRLKNILGS